MKIQSFLLAATAGLALAGTANAATITGTFSAALIGVASTPPGIGPGAVLTNAIGLVSSSTDQFTPIAALTPLTFASVTATNGTPVSFTSSFGNFTGTLSNLSTAPAPNALVNFDAIGVFTPSGTLNSFMAGNALLTVGFTQTGALGNIPPAISGSFTFASAAVPEPASWAMLVVGFGLVGVATRRRKAVVAA